MTGYSFITNLPMIGIREAGGILTSKINSKTKNAIKMLMPGIQYTHVFSRTDKIGNQRVIKG